MSMTLRVSITSVELRENDFCKVFLFTTWFWTTEATMFSYVSKREIPRSSYETNELNSICILTVKLYLEGTFSFIVLPNSFTSGVEREVALTSLRSLYVWVAFCLVNMGCSHGHCWTWTEFIWQKSSFLLRLLVLISLFPYLNSVNHSDGAIPLLTLIIGANLLDGNN